MLGCASSEGFTVRGAQSRLTRCRNTCKSWHGLRWRVGKRVMGGRVCGGETTVDQCLVFFISSSIAVLINQLREMKQCTHALHICH